MDKSKQRRCISLLIIGMLLLGSFSSVAADEPVHNVLILHSYHKGLNWTDQLQVGIEEALEDEPIQYYIEYMDSYRQGTKISQDELLHYYTLKYEDVDLEVVVACDNYAFDFLSNYKDVLFPELPVVFGGVNNFDDTMLFKEEITGVVQTNNHVDTIKLMTHLNPALEVVIALGGDNATAIAETNQILQVGETSFGHLKFVKVLENDLTKQLDQLSKYEPSTTAILVSGTMLDHQGFFYDHGHYAQLIEDATGLPVYAMSDVYMMDNGALGGYVVKAEDQGRTIGQYVKDILSGKPASSLQINKTPASIPLFNYLRLQEFDIKPTSLPPGSEFEDEPAQTVVVSSEVLILLGLLLLVIVTSMVLLITSALRRKKTEQILDEHTIKLEHLAYHDSTTNLYNRGYLLDFLQEHLLDAVHPFTALYNLDVVNMKMINDAYGHDVGDRVLQHMAELLRNEFDSDLECIGIYHTELLIVDSTLDDVESVKIRISNLIRRLSHTTIIDYMEINIKVNVGIALAPEHSIDAKLLLKKANIALIESTKYGPNHYHLFEDTLYKDVLRRITLEKQLRRAVNNDEFVIFYQPRINMKDMTVSGCEALIRWNHPDGHLVYPNHFIPLAESVGFIEEITKWVIYHVSNQVMEWAGMGHQIKVSFNISGKEFDDDFIKMLRQIIKEVGVNPELLEVEITETAALKDIDHSKTLVDTLNDIGVSVALDDFGTGYSSMTYIKKLKASKLKIDKTFIDDIEEYEQKVVVDSMIQLGQKLNYCINVEGVETEEQLRILKYLKVDEIQGWLFSKAIPADDFIVYVNELKRKQLDNPQET